MSPTVVNHCPRECPQGSGKRGRPAHVPSQELRNAISVLRANGLGVEDIAKLLHLTRRTLKRHYRDELESGREEMKAALGSMVVHKALNGNWRAALWWLQRFGGSSWKCTEVRLHGNSADAQPIKIATRARVIIVPADA